MSYPTGGPPGYPAYPPTAGGPGFNVTPGGGYPPQGGGMYPPAPGYPPAGSGGYPQAGGYPPVTSSYPGQPATGSPYPVQQPSGGSYPGQPPASTYPAQPPAGYPPQPGYPSQPQGYPGGGAPGYAPYGQYPLGGSYSTPAMPYVPTSHSPSQPGGYPCPGSNPSSVYPVLPQGQGGRMMQGTVRPNPGFNPADDAQALRKAMKGFGTDEKAIINVLCARTNDQRLQIYASYKQSFGKDLIKDLKSELSGKLEDVIVALMTPTYEFLASELRRAIAGLGTDENCLIEVLCTRSNADIQRIKDEYRRLYSKDLEQSIVGDTSGHMQRILVSMCNASRQEGVPVDPNRARDDAHKLYQAGVGKWGTDESTFNMILASQSHEQLLLVFQEYQSMTNHTIMNAIEREMSGDVKEAFIAIAKAVSNVSSFFAEKLHQAMKGAGTDDRTLIRIVVTRSEVDMVQIKDEYYRLYKKPLEKAINDDTSGDYRKALIALIQG